MEQLSPNLHRLVSRQPGPHAPVNSYRWRTPGATILIDPAADVTPATLGDAVVTDILVTHLQAENIAGAANFPDARLHVPAGDEYLCAGPAAYAALPTTWPPPWEWATRGNYQGNIGGARNERPTPEPLRLAAPLRPGERFLDAEILATPGHGKHAVTILAAIDGQRVGFCGDVVHGDGRLWNWFDSEWDYGLETGPRALQEAVRHLAAVRPGRLCPTHGPVISDPAPALARLAERLAAVLAPVPAPPFDWASVAVDAPPGPAPGFRTLSPHLLQWTANHGNCAAVLSATGNALLVDDGLCQWVSLPEREAFHRRAIAALKAAAGIRRIEWVIPTHYHGDHVENIPDLVDREGTQVVCLDTVADVLEHPERFNLVSTLPWYGTGHDTVRVDWRVPSGTRFRWQEYEIEIFQLGGQTWYAAGIAIVVDGQRVLFVGDSFGGDACDPVLCYNDADPATRGWAYASRVMREQRPDLIVCAHGSAVRQPRALLERKCRLWERRLAQYAALAARPDLRLFFDPFYK